MAHNRVGKAKILSLTFGECRHLQSRMPALWLYTHVLTRNNCAWKHCWKWLSRSPLRATVTVSKLPQIIQHDALWTWFLVYERAKVHKSTKYCVHFNIHLYFWPKIVLPTVTRASAHCQDTKKSSVQSSTCLTWRMCCHKCSMPEGRILHWQYALKYNP